MTRTADGTPPSSGGHLTVRGGTGGTSVGLESLDQAAATLLRVSRDVAEVAGRLAVAAADPVLLATSLLSPATGARAEGALGACLAPHRIVRDVVDLASLATAVRAATCAYRAVEEGVMCSVEAVQDAVMLGVGAQWPAVTLAAAGLEVAGVDQGAALDRTVFLAPWTADLAGGAEGLVLGAALSPLSAVPFGTALALDAATGGVGSAPGYEDGVRVLSLAASGVGLLSEPSLVRVVPRPAPRAGAGAPSNLADLTRDQRNLSDGEDYPGHVRVVEVPQPAGGSAWVVEVSGTQAWDPRAGGNPFDLTSDVRLTAQQPTALTAGAAQALALAQADAAAARAAGTAARAAGGAPRDVADEPVLLVGHSLGGIAASALATSPTFTAGHRVTHVVTMGSPVSRAAMAPSVEVLSLEHHQDAVPRLDGQPNPDSRHWVTATRDLADDPEARTAAAAHDGTEYVETAALVDASDDPSVAHWRESARAFFVADRYGAPVIRDYRLERVGPQDAASGVAQSEP